MKSVVILISGRGSNMIRIAEACHEEQWPARISCVISNRPDAPGLTAARAIGLLTEVVDHRAFASREAFDDALASTIERFNPDLLVLAGFMRILGANFVARFAGRFVNIHPSLLPAFPGLHTHARALAGGCKVHGATVHFVTAELDVGPIIGQAVVPVLDDDSADSLMARVQAAEHRLYPAAIGWLLHDRVHLEAGVTRLRPPEPGAAAALAAQPALQIFGASLEH